MADKQEHSSSPTVVLTLHEMAESAKIGQNLVNARWFAEWDEVVAQLHAFHLTGDVLELAAGTGTWTQQLLPSPSTAVTVEASAEMLAINQAKVASPRVSYVLADLFGWQPERIYDALFFGFCLSHVPREQA